MKSKDMQEESTIPTLVDRVRAGKMSRRQLVTTLTAIGLSFIGVSTIIAALKPLTSEPYTVAPTPEDPTTHLQLHDQHLVH